MAENYDPGESAKALGTLIGGLFDDLAFFFTFCTFFWWFLMIFDDFPRSKLELHRPRMGHQDFQKIKKPQKCENSTHNLPRNPLGGTSWWFESPKYFQHPNPVRFVHQNPPNRAGGFEDAPYIYMMPAREVVTFLLPWICSKKNP